MPATPFRARPTPRLAGLALALALAATAGRAARAEDDFDDIFGEDENADDDGSEASGGATGTGQEDDGDFEEDPEDDDDWTVTPEDSSELLFDDELEEAAAVQVQGEGEDTARIYRAQLEAVEDLGPDEEALAWERYLKKYPNSVFRSRIEQRLDDLQAELFQEHVEDRYSHTDDAGRAEIQFAQPMGLESIDPRTRIRAGLDLGFPSYAGLQADLEWQLKRELSVHGGIRARPSGENIEAGVRYALVKSARTNLLVTAIGDLHLNIDPLQTGFRPLLGVGKRFVLSGDGVALDAMAQAGTDLVLVKNDLGNSQLSVRETGGLHLTVVPTPVVRIWFEANVYMKDIGDPDLERPFQFDTIAFGLKFVGRKNPREARYEVGIGATAPVAMNYWAYHFGALNADINYYLD